MKKAVRNFLLRVGRRLPKSLRYLSFEIGAPLLEGAILDSRCVTSTRWSLENMRRLGFSPQRIMDVGAYVGDWTRLARSCFPNASIHMIEAQVSKETVIAAVATETGATYTIGVLGPEDGKTVTFYEMETGSSVLPELSNFARTERTATTTTLDTVVRNIGWPSVDLLKLDVQGYELQILAGGANVLRDCQALLLEVAVVPINAGAPVIGEVLDYLQKRGFILYDICTLLRRPLDAALVQLDVIFVRSDHALVRQHGLNRSEG